MKQAAVYIITFLAFFVLACDPGDDEGGGTECVNKGGFCSTYQEGCTGDTMAWTELGCTGQGATCCIPTDSCGEVKGYCSNVNSWCTSGYGPIEGTDCPGSAGLCCVPLATGLGEPPYSTYDNPFASVQTAEFPVEPLHPVSTKTVLPDHKPEPEETIQDRGTIRGRPEPGNH